jgi:hypothetical protein
MAANGNIATEIIKVENPPNSMKLKWHQEIDDSGDYS